MNQFDSVKDSGARQTFSTGSVRDTQTGKGRYDLSSPIVNERDAKHYENGAKKYGDRNWEKGQPLSRFLDSALRHINKYREGHRDEDHLAAARWNLAGLIHVEEMIERGVLPKELDDLPSYVRGEPVKVEWPKKYREAAFPINDAMRWWEERGDVYCVGSDGRINPSAHSLSEFRDLISKGEFVPE